MMEIVVQTTGAVRWRDVPKTPNCVTLVSLDADNPHGAVLLKVERTSERILLWLCQDQALTIAAGLVECVREHQKPEAAELPAEAA
jgi:hypothetical protein